MQGNQLSKKHRGIIPRLIHDLFDRIRDSYEENQFIVRIAMVEIYKEKLQDLLNPQHSHLVLREDPDNGVFIEGLYNESVSNEERVH